MVDLDGILEHYETISMERLHCGLEVVRADLLSFELLSGQLDERNLGVGGFRHVFVSESLVYVEESGRFSIYGIFSGVILITPDILLERGDRCGSGSGTYTGPPTFPDSWPDAPRVISLKQKHPSGLCQVHYKLGEGSYQNNRTSLPRSLLLLVVAYERHC